MHPPNAKDYIDIAMSGTWPNCVATLTRKASAPDCSPNNVRCGGNPTPPPGAAVPPSQGYLQSVSNNLYVTVDPTSKVLAATASSTSSAALFAFTNAGGYTIQNLGTQQFASADNWGNNPLVANRPTAGGWETYNFLQVGSNWAIQVCISSQYLLYPSNLLIF